jgi:SAM-dependent methyltransferase
VRKCLNCHQVGDLTVWHCEKCGWEPQKKAEMQMFAPELSGITESYDPAWYQELFILESKNFWFTSRNRLLEYFGHCYFSEKGQYLEIGCGTGYVLKMIYEKFPKLRVMASEAQVEGLIFAKNRVKGNVDLCQMDACSIPFQEEFDVIGAYDVIEHIQDHKKVIRQVYDALKVNGIFMVTVPQHMFLWSQYDEVGCHYRRYERGELEDLLRDAGFLIKRTTSFNALLLPMMIISRWFKKDKNEKEQFDVLEELRLSGIVNTVLSFILKIELALIKLGFNLPMGGSRVIVAQKR